MRWLLILFLLLPSITFAADTDRVRVQVCFRKVVWDCPKGEEVTDLNIAGGNTYTHKCSDDIVVNRFINYDGCLAYTEDEYRVTNPTKLSSDKTAMFNKWNYERKNPPPYVEPSLEDLQSVKQGLLDEISRLDEQIVKKQK